MARLGSSEKRLRQESILSMRNIAISISVVVAMSMTCEVALSGERDPASSPWYKKLFQGTVDSGPQTREAELRVLIAIRSEQEEAWREYILARRQNKQTADRQRRQEYLSSAVGDTGFDLTTSTADSHDPVLTSRLALKEKYDALYALLDDAQKARADRELTPGECGR